jgi:hypothetical protein
MKPSQQTLARKAWHTAHFWKLEAEFGCSCDNGNKNRLRAWRETFVLKSPSAFVLSWIANKTTVLAER